MNDTEETMFSNPPTKRLEVIDVALEAAGTALALVNRVPAKFKSLADQVIRSAASVPANLAEGHGRAGRDRFCHYRVATASAKEIDIHLQLLVQARMIDASQAAKTIAMFDRVRAMTWRLIHPRR